MQPCMRDLGPDPASLLLPATCYRSRKRQATWDSLRGTAIPHSRPSYTASVQQPPGPGRFWSAFAVSWCLRCFVWGSRREPGSGGCASTRPLGVRPAAQA